jgi:hypothetical protein
MVSDFSTSHTGGPTGPDLAPLAALRGYWEALRQNGRLPARADIDPRGIAPALENAFLVDRIAPGLAKFRLCGMSLHDLMGMEPAGMPLSTLFEPTGRSRLGPALEQVFQGPTILELWLEAERGLGRPALTGRMVLLPLLNASGEVTVALGGLVTSGTVGRQPRRFAIASALSETLVVAAAGKTEQAWARELAEEPAVFQAQQRPAPLAPGARPKLRIVSSRD